MSNIKIVFLAKGALKKPHGSSRSLPQEISALKASFPRPFRRKGPFLQLTYWQVPSYTTCHNITTLSHCTHPSSVFCCQHSLLSMTLHILSSLWVFMSLLYSLLFHKQPSIWRNWIFTLIIQLTITLIVKLITKTSRLNVCCALMGVFNT